MRLQSLGAGGREPCGYETPLGGCGSATLMWLPAPASLCQVHPRLNTIVCRSPPTPKVRRQGKVNRAAQLSPRFVAHRIKAAAANSELRIGHARRRIWEPDSRTSIERSPVPECM